MLAGHHLHYQWALWPLLDSPYIQYLSAEASTYCGEGYYSHFSILITQSYRTVIFNQCAVATGPQVCHRSLPQNGPQVCCRSLGESHLLLGPLGDVSPPQEVGYALSIVKKPMVCLNNFSTLSVCHEMKKVQNRCSSPIRKEFHLGPGNVLCCSPFPSPLPKHFYFREGERGGGSNTG